MEAYKTQVMELLSLGEESNGFQIRIGITNHDKQASFVMDIDEFTFRHLHALQPLNRGRLRLSPYPKWDPFRNTYYLSLVSMAESYRETLYFDCSNEFVTNLQQIRNTGLTLYSNNVQDVQKAVAGNVSERQGQQHQLLGFSKRKVWIFGCLLAACSLLILISIRSETNWFMGEGNSLGSPASSLKAEAEAASWNEGLPPPIALPAFGKDWDSVVATTTAAPLEDISIQDASLSNSIVEQIDYEIKEIEGDQSFFGLPEGDVALTFDDGPSPLTKQIVDILIEHKVAATFLFIGNNVNHHPEEVTYAFEHGMSIGNHSWSHSVLTKVGPSEQAEDLAKTSSILESLMLTPVTLFRPPYGSTNDMLKASAKKQNMKILLWNRDPQDWNAKKPEDIIQYFKEVQASGGVYVLHEDKMTLEALPEIIAYLKSNNLKFITFK